MNKALIITGIGDDTHHLEQATKAWPERYEIEPVMHVFGWQGEAEELDDRMGALEAHAVDIGADAVIGVSAGASAGARLAVKLGLHYENVCGRLHQAGNNIYDFEKYRLRAPMFVESVHRAEEMLPQLDPKRSFIWWAYFDALVPRQAAMVEGVESSVAPLPSHPLGIYSVLRFRGRAISTRIKENSTRKS